MDDGWIEGWMDRSKNGGWVDRVMNEGVNG